MLKIKLQPVGKKGQKSFRIIVDQAKSKLNSSHIAQIGSYDPKSKKLDLDKKELNKWQKNGAQITTGVDKILNPKKYKGLAEKKKANRLARRQKGQEQPKKEDVKPTKESESNQKETKNEIKSETKNESA